MAEYLEKVSSKGLSRRSFVQMTAASAALLTLAGCTQNTVTTTAGTKAEPDLVNGEWRTVACWQTCHTTCINKGYIVDGIPIAIKPDDSHPDSPDYPQQRGCVKGRSLRQFVTGEDRLKYPMKRKSWQPGGGDNVHAELRGKDEWERISWEDALDMAAAEFTRIRDTYGNKSIASRIIDRIPFLAAFGGYTSVWGNQSDGGNAAPYAAMRGPSAAGKTPQDRFALRHAKLILLWGYNPIYSAGGSNTNYIRHAKDAGAKVIAIDPWFSPSAQGLADEYVPCRPGTDAAMMAAIAYHMIENDLHDQEFLDKYTVGFDANHMPEGEEGQENFKDYILGAYDGTPKTPEWASEICGASPEAIRNLAEQMATVKPMAFKAGQCIGRAYNGIETTQMFHAVGWMTGNLGQPGMEVEECDGNSGVLGGPAIVSSGASLIVTPPNKVATFMGGAASAINAGKFDPAQYYGIAYADFWDAIITGKQTHFQDGEIDVNIKCLVKFGRGCNTNQNVGMAEAVKALRMPNKVEFNITSDYFMCPDCQYSDIVLPAQTPWEREGGWITSAFPNREALYYTKKTMEPLFECKTDNWINYELCKRCGIDTSEIGPEDPEIDALSRVATAKVKLPDNSGDEFLCEVTAEDISEYGLLIEPHEGRMPYKELIDNGSYQVERKDGDAFTYVPLESFIKDPVANPLGTPSGKLEIFCRTLEQRIALYNTTTVSPIPKYIPAKEGFEEASNQYPYQILGIHIVRQAHSVYGNVKSIAEYFPNDLVVSEIDANDLGLKTGDTALITNQYGKMLRRVAVSPRVMPGVVIIGQGNWTEYDDTTGIDFGANINTVTPSHLVTTGIQCYNTILVNIEKYSGTPLDPDYIRPQVIVNV